MTIIDIETKGFVIHKQIIDKQSLYELAYNFHYCDHPTHGHDYNGKYYATYQDDVEWANYWSKPLNDHDTVISIRKILDPIIHLYLRSPVFYQCNASVITPKNSLIRPHVDTPHRHLRWNKDTSCRLAMQVAIPLAQFDISQGTTAFVPGSHNRAWDIKACYRGEYTKYFLENCVQPKISFGDAVIWDSRVLHSQMPNIQGTNRVMILMNYLEEDIVQDVIDYEESQKS